MTPEYPWFYRRIHCIKRSSKKEGSQQQASLFVSGAMVTGIWVRDGSLEQMRCIFGWDLEDISMNVNLRCIYLYNRYLWCMWTCKVCIYDWKMYTHSDLRTPKMVQLYHYLRFAWLVVGNICPKCWSNGGWHLGDQLMKPMVEFWAVCDVTRLVDSWQVGNLEMWWNEKTSESNISIQLDFHMQNHTQILGLQYPFNIASNGSK